MVAETWGGRYVEERRNYRDNKIYVRLWVRQQMITTEDMRDDEDSGRRDTGGQDWAHWAGNCPRCPTCQNGNNGFDGSLSVSHRGAANKEPSRPAYRMQDQNNGNGVLTGLSDAGL